MQDGHNKTASSPVKCRVLSRSHPPSMVTVSYVAYLMTKKHNSWKDNEIVNCHLLTRNLASLWYGIDGRTHWWMSFPRF